MFNYKRDDLPNAWQFSFHDLILALFTSPFLSTTSFVKNIIKITHIHEERIYKVDNFFKPKKLLKFRTVSILRLIHIKMVTNETR